MALHNFLFLLALSNICFFIIPSSPLGDIQSHKLMGNYGSTQLPVSCISKECFFLYHRFLSPLWHSFTQTPEIFFSLIFPLYPSFSQYTPLVCFSSPFSLEIPCCTHVQSMVVLASFCKKKKKKRHCRFEPLLHLLENDPPFTAKQEDRHLFSILFFVSDDIFVCYNTLLCFWMNISMSL